MTKERHANQSMLVETFIIESKKETVHMLRGQVNVSTAPRTTLWEVPELHTCQAAFDSFSDKIPDLAKSNEQSLCDENPVQRQLFADSKISGRCFLHMMRCLVPTHLALMILLCYGIQ